MDSAGTILTNSVGEVFSVAIKGIVLVELIAYRASWLADARSVVI
jgi:hypothetical protein